MRSLIIVVYPNFKSRHTYVDSCGTIRSSSLFKTITNQASVLAGNTDDLRVSSNFNKPLVIINHLQLKCAFSMFFRNKDCSILVISKLVQIP